jgi:hypothetical protein
MVNNVNGASKGCFVAPGRQESCVVRKSAPRRNPDRPASYRPRLTVNSADRPGDGAGLVHLTKTEWEVLAVLVRNPGKLISRRQLLQDVWGPTYLNETHNLRQYMAQLRKKLEPDFTRPRYSSPNSAWDTASYPDRSQRPQRNRTGLAGHKC